MYTCIHLSVLIYLIYFFVRETGVSVRARYNATESIATIVNIKLKNNPTAQYINVSRRRVVSESN